MNEKEPESTVLHSRNSAAASWLVSVGPRALVDQDVEQKHYSKLPIKPSDEDKCMVDKPAGLIQRDEKVTLESIHQAEAAEASSSWREKKVESILRIKEGRIKKGAMTNTRK